MPENLPIPAERIAQAILFVRNERVMMDADLAKLYGVPTKALLQAVKRNLVRFPADFMFQLTADETESLRSQIVTSKTGRGGRRYYPFVFRKKIRRAI
jgi:ORF6N domain-containing protein